MRCPIMAYDFLLHIHFLSFVWGLRSQPRFWLFATFGMYNSRCLARLELPVVYPQATRRCTQLSYIMHECMASCA